MKDLIWLRKPKENPRPNNLYQVGFQALHGIKQKNFTDFGEKSSDYDPGWDKVEFQCFLLENSWTHSWKCQDCTVS